MTSRVGCLISSKHITLKGSNNTYKLLTSFAFMTCFCINKPWDIKYSNIVQFSYCEYTVVVKNMHIRSCTKYMELLVSQIFGNSL